MSARLEEEGTKVNRGHVLIIVQNLPVPLDRRVWLECQALTAAGFDVSVICPKGPNDPAYQELSGVHIHKYAPPPQANGALGYLLEFVYCWLRTARLTFKVWRRQPFTVMQACNPPDTYWALARLWRARGVKFVFDHHDLNPEVFRSRFGEPKGLAARVQLAGLYWLERKTFHTADRVISTNQSYQRIAWERGGVPPEHTTVVRSGPDTSAMKPGEPRPQLRNGREHLVAWLGIMGPQDGVDGVLEIARKVVKEHGREDVQFALMGFGDCLEDLKKQCTGLGLDDYVTFTGRVGPKEIADYLSTSSLGLSADPLSPLNDVSTMNKTMEYMAYALPVVAYRLTETVVSAGDCAVYLEPGDADGFAKSVIDLLDDPARRKDLGTAGRRRAEQVLDWRPQAKAYVEVYESLSGLAPELSVPPSRPAVV
ncbi:glycosyltransferase family 4 protein [Kibdelosporangium phytohabitans]|uniref:Glycosyl transferase family 1 n=1 Tax=Kibdelosporangium phytohabitans TaxID=860235 RepID=A0A0N9I284_9PSEU|nr:glycosyltransferase family 4 protein [Kibdelosporangium phytohabitans]ALG14074.1 glycosyl transferase family 1 [Kibdelosporangium phytohabitans]MBE1466955.1 glycosyltransferase involved in cell wall biosynthesis [Kibdelosporangium phytohabitans]